MTKVIRCPVTKAFKQGDYLLYWNSFQSSKPVVGVITEAGEKARVEWDTETTSYNVYVRHSKEVTYDLTQQFRIWNGNDPSFKYFPRRLVKQRMKKPKFKVGDLITIYKPGLSTQHNKEQRDLIGSTGIVIELDHTQLYAKVYLQAKMIYVWRETDEIRKA